MLFGHGTWDTKTESWRMENKEKVKDIVAAWGRYAQEKGLPPISFIASCQPQKYTPYKATTREKILGLIRKSIKNKLDIKRLRNEVVMPEFGGRVVESVGSLMRVYNLSQTDLCGSSVLVVDVEDGVFSGLDEALLAQELTLS